MLRAIACILIALSVALFLTAPRAPAGQLTARGLLSPFAAIDSALRAAAR